MAELTDQEVESLRRMVGWRPDWVRDPETLRSPESLDREQRVREWLDREGIDPSVRLPHGAVGRACAELGIGAEAFDWSMRQIRGGRAAGKRVAA